MKKVIFGLVALFASSVALACEECPGAGAVSGSLSGTHAGASAIGGGSSTDGSGVGFSYQFSNAGAQNTTSAGAFSEGNGRSVELGAGVFSSGKTYSYSYGDQGGNGRGFTTGFASQYGGGDASAHGDVYDYSGNESGFGEGGGHASVSSFADQESVAKTRNVGNGESEAWSDGFSYSSNTARLEITAHPDSVSVEQSSDSIAEAGGGGGTLVSGGGTAFARGFGKASGEASTFADTETYSNGGDYEKPKKPKKPEPKPKKHGERPGWGHGAKDNGHYGPPGLGYEPTPVVD